MDWSNEMVLEFLDLYEREPAIWNPSHVSYKNRGETIDAWKRIQERFNGSGSVEDLKKKKDSLMASFRSCLRKVNNSTMKAETDEGVYIYKPTWFAYEKMLSFLRERDQPGSGISLNFEVEDEDYSIPDPNWENQISAVFVNEYQGTTASSIKRKAETQDESSAKAPPPKIKIVESLGAQNQLRYNAFGDYVAEELRTMPAAVVPFVKKLINEAIFEGHMGTLNRLSSIEIESE